LLLLFLVKKFLLKSKEDANYTIDQALGMLFWRRYNFEKAFIDIKQYELLKNWTEKDCTKFEDAFKMHGKNFTSIRLMVFYVTFCYL